MSGEGWECNHNHVHDWNESCPDEEVTLSCQPCGCDPDYVGEQGYDQGKSGWECSAHKGLKATVLEVSRELSKPTIKDSGKRQQFSSGMQRDVTEGKTDYTLVMDGPMFERWATHLTNGAKKYDKRNWMKANGPVELERFRESALRHFLQWFNGATDEDHASATLFNINGAEYVRTKL